MIQKAYYFNNQIVIMNSLCTFFLYGKIIILLIYPKMERKMWIRNIKNNNNNKNCKKHIFFTKTKTKKLLLIFI